MNKLISIIPNNAAVFSCLYSPDSQCVIIDNRAAGTGPAGQAMAGPLFTIIVKYCNAQVFIFQSGIANRIDSLPRGAADLAASAEYAH